MELKQPHSQSFIRRVPVYVWIVGGSILVLAVVYLAVVYSVAYEVSLWDWLKLLIVPAAIAATGVLFNWAQAKREREIEERRAQDAALQAYLDFMTKLLVEQPLRRSRPGDTLSIAARAQTITILERLDEPHKTSVLQFIYESGLLNKEDPVIDISGADLRQALLSPLANLSGAHLSGANLTGAYLMMAYLVGAYLESAYLFGANLTRASLSGANLSNAILVYANLSGAELYEADLSNADLRESNLSYPPSYSDLTSDVASLANRYYLSGSKVEPSPHLYNLAISYAAKTDPNPEVDPPQGAYLSGANLTGADLRGTDLRGAILSDAVLGDARGLTQEQLELAIGDEHTRLPKNLQRPEAWTS